MIVYKQTADFDIFVKKKYIDFKFTEQPHIPLQYLVYVLKNKTIIHQDYQKRDNWGFSDDDTQKMLKKYKNIFIHTKIAATIGAS